MIAEGIKAIANLASEASAPVTVLEDHAKKSVVINGLLTDVDKDTPPRSHRVYSLEDLVQLAVQYTSDDEKDEPPEMVVWYNNNEVTLVFDNLVYRANKAVLNLKLSEAFNTVLRLEKRPKFEQPEFIRLLRIDLARAIDPVTLLNIVRDVRFESQRIVSGKITKNEESMGRSISSKVESVDIPEEVTLQVPIYSNKGETDRYAIRCAVDVDPAMGTFQLYPLPDELTRVVQLAVDSIGERLNEGLPSVVPAYYGAP